MGVSEDYRLYLLYVRIQTLYIVDSEGYRLYLLYVRIPTLYIVNSED